ncbi:hypothetical protein AA0242T_1909 [Acetobacter aceti NRIC 0242]|uniref:Uncharacterized protein n=2 Tax=Acetobacter aceti TaxID=435 RepID=A0A6S6PQ21_ACEAC|nr:MULTISPECIES: hypothetical protein [Acetobacter]GBO81207.1 hypothetical protein AA0242T_1909 [Acetobacter aceti NRIC 0242]TCS35280.1 hypothetical protein EDC15_10177 [Acetobacter aceti NBRC 14818]BCI66782.1 hypothetical protein AAJCM20276_14060 [Acetobacter aceti]BCK75332.1 hypothetical protein EMQ_0938 [Acetobacter aceti NBRC 14818]GAN57378.1 hypothetical protein Abac_017_079 [Acetobacter aceti NBRC 14818]
MATEGPEAQFLKPRLNALVAEAAKNGFSTDVTIAVLLDLLDTESFGVTTPEGEDE